MSRWVSRRKLLIEVRRRGWVVVLSTLIVVGVAWGVGRSVTPSASATAVLVVRAGGPTAAQPDASTKLAPTYSSLIPLDASIKRSVERELPSEGSYSYSTSLGPNTAVIEVAFKAHSKSEAMSGADAVARAVSGPKPVSKNIIPNSLAIVRLPTSASESALSSELLAVALIVGLLLGFVLLSFWRPRDARIDVLRDVRLYFDGPCLEVRLATMAGVRPLYDLVAGTDSHTITAVVPCRARDVKMADCLSEILREAPGGGSVIRTGVPGSDEAGELGAATAANRILVVQPGVRRAAMSDVIDVLDRYHAAPAYAVLAIDRRAPKRVSMPDPTDSSEAASASTTVS
jgi:capsular polysaccharide biosynthesis protein